MSSALHVSGGKTWSPPGINKKSSLKTMSAPDIIFLAFMSFFTALLVFMIIGFIMKLTNFNLIDFSSAFPKPATPINKDSIYPKEIVQKGIDIFPYIGGILMATPIVALIFLWPENWRKSFISLIAIVILILSLTNMIGNQYNSMNMVTPMNPMSWMGERYGFEPIAEVKENTMYEGMLLRDKENKNIAEVKEHNGGYLLYTLEGTELPLNQK